MTSQATTYTASIVYALLVFCGTAALADRSLRFLVALFGANVLVAWLVCASIALAILG
jgi:hypothetical protein